MGKAATRIARWAITGAQWKRIAGWSLVEMVIALAIGAMLLTFGVPAYQDWYSFSVCRRTGTGWRRNNSSTTRSFWRKH